MAVKKLKDPILSFSGLDMDFKINELTKDIDPITGVESVKQSLKNLLMLRKNEKPFHPEIYSGVMDLLFEPANPLVVFQLKRQIKELIVSYEKRVRASDIKIAVTDLSENNAYKIDIEFQVENSVETFKATVIMERIR